MISENNIIFLENLAKIDPGPFFILSLLPYLFFIYWLNKVSVVPKLAQWGFRATLLFVFITIICAIIAKIGFQAELTDIDPLHGLAESFLTLSDALIVIGFLGALDKIK